MKYCNHCGEKIEDNIRYCPKCGTEQQITTVHNSSDSKKRNVLIIAGVVLTVVIIIAAIVVTILLSRQSSDSHVAQATTEATTEQQTTEAPTTEEPTTEEVTTEENKKEKKAKKKKKSAPVEYKLMEGDYKKGGSVFSVTLQDGESYYLSGAGVNGGAFLGYEGNGVYNGSWYVTDNDNKFLTDITIKTTKTGFTLTTANTDTAGGAWVVDESFPGTYVYQGGTMQKKSSSGSTSSKSSSGGTGYYTVKVKEGTYLALRSTPETRDDNIEGKLYNGQTVQVDSVNGNFAWVYSEDLEQSGYVNADYLWAE